MLPFKCSIVTGNAFLAQLAQSTHIFNSSNKSRRLSVSYHCSSRKEKSSKAKQARYCVDDDDDNDENSAEKRKEKETQNIHTLLSKQLDPFLRISSNNSFVFLYKKHGRVHCGAL